MSEVATYTQPKIQPYTPPNMPEGSGMSTKTKILIGVGVATAVGFGIRWAYKVYQRKQSDKAEGKSFTEGTGETSAKKIHMAFDNDGFPGTNTVELREIITKVKSLQEWENIVTSYKTLYDKDLNRRIEDELQSSEFKEFLAIKGAKPFKTGQKVSGDVLYRSWAIRLRAAFEKTYGFISGTDDNAVDAVFAEIPTQRAFINVGKAYNKEYKGADFIKELKSEVNYDKYMNIILRKKPA
jgi:hypothetical protein